jgi:DnaA family protein
VNLQLALGFALKNDATFTSLYPGINAKIISLLLDSLKGYLDNFVYLSGASGTGKSHILQACCHLATEYGKNSVYIPLANHEFMTPEVLDGMENISLVCIDDLQAIAGNYAWEEKIFHTYNKIKENENILIIASELMPGNLNLGLQDLQSRLCWGLIHTLNEISDEDKVKALQLRATVRGFSITDLVAKFLINRCPRDMHLLFNTLEDLDKASLEKQRKVTIPFVKEILGV